jgi:hypothetical protein
VGIQLLANLQVLRRPGKECELVCMCAGPQGTHNSRGTIHFLFHTNGTL